MEERAWALDCGIGIYRDAPPPSGVEIGDFVRGTANLWVDPFFYFEHLHAVLKMPPLISMWLIDAISLAVAPFVRADNILSRDPTKPGWLPLKRTDAWHDDDAAPATNLTASCSKRRPSERATPPLDPRPLSDAQGVARSICLVLLLSSGGFVARPFGAV